MIFHKGEPNPYYDNFLYTNRLQSENNLWGIAFEHILYGRLRVVVFRVNSDSITLNICTGAQSAYSGLIYDLIVRWLMTFDESITESQLQKEFPRFEVKPIYNDPNWQKNLEILTNRIINNKKMLGN